jgi:predicted nucleotidyltransferase
MKHIEEIKKTLSAHRKIFASKYKVKTIGVFGSYVRGKPKKKSDIDILVEFKKAVDFFEFLDLEEYLEQIFGIKVDLVTKQALKPHMGKHILEEVVYL